MLTFISPTVVAVLEIITGAGIITFWVLFFKTDLLIPENPPEGYLAHEHSFVYPDSVMAIALIAGGILLIIQNPLGEKLSLVSAGGLMFLGIIDFAYDIRNGIFKGGAFEFIENFIVDIWVLLLGLVIVFRFI